jgi:signal transduction histidine kinase
VSTSGRNSHPPLTRLAYPFDDATPAELSGSHGSATVPPSVAALRRRQIHHDIHHELGTIKLLSSLLSSAEDIGPESRERAHQILGETRWLHQLVQAFEESFAEPDEPPLAPATPVRIDRYAAEVVRAVQMSTFTQVHLEARTTSAYVEALGFWRALRNIVDNAVRAAGPRGRVEVLVRPEAGWALMQVDDDGPGFGAAAPGAGSLGLGIVQDLAARAGGELEIRRGVLGGCCVMLRLPAAPTVSTLDQGEE